MSHNEHRDPSAAPEHFTAAGEKFRIVSENPADLRAVGVGGAIDGEEFRFVKRSLTVARYEAICDAAGPAPRTYTARRTGGSFMEKRRLLIDGAGNPIATTHGLPNGEIRIDQVHPAAVELDLGFIAWALSYVDAPMRNIRLA